MQLATVDANTIELGVPKIDNLVDNSVGKEVLPNQLSRTLLKQLELMSSGGGWVVDGKESSWFYIITPVQDLKCFYQVTSLSSTEESKDQVFPATPRRTDLTNYVNTLWQASEPFPPSQCP